MRQLGYQLWRSAASALAVPRNGPGRQFSGSVGQVLKGRFANAGPQGLGIPGAAAIQADAAASSEAGLAQQVSPTRRRIGAFFRVFLPLGGASCLTYAFLYPDHDPLVAQRLPPELQYMQAMQTANQETLINWSGTHEAKPQRLLQPENEVEVATFLRLASRGNQKLRVVGSALSPNGMGLSNQGTLSMALMDQVLSVDKLKQQVTVQAGCRVQALADALVPYGLTLQNFASVREQQAGGYTQVGAHGTGARIPPVDEQVVSMRLVTPAMGALNLSRDTEVELFNLAKVGLGALGVVTQLTLQCVPRHRLVERTFTASVADVKKNHVKWLQTHQHLRYMWLPYTDKVVVVQVDKESSPAGQAALAGASLTLPVVSPTSPATEVLSTSGQDAAATAHKLQPLLDLLRSKPALLQQAGGAAQASTLTATQLRDTLLAADPLNKDWVAAVNRAEAEYWSRNAGVRAGWSDQILGFDCGGQQWVMEVCMPVGQLDSLSGTTRDLEFMQALMAEIKTNKVPAPCPIEQRWSSGSSSPMSPSHGKPQDVHSWVGIIMYLPDDAAARQQVTQAFSAYARLVQDRLMPKFNATWHWAKLEVPADHASSAAAAAELKAIRARLAARYPVRQFNAYREVLDPANILGNEWLDALLPLSASA